jgi:hypothetical protein
MVYENGVLRGLFGPKREEVEGGWRRLHNEELHKLHMSSNIIRVIKSRGMRWARHVARMGEVRNVYTILNGNLKGKDHSEDLSVDGRLILGWIFGA